MPAKQPTQVSTPSDHLPLQFPAAGAHSATRARTEIEDRGSTTEVLEALQSVSRRITDLARELHCLGYFDDANDGRPRAA